MQKIALLLLVILSLGGCKKSNDKNAAVTPPQISLKDSLLTPEALLLIPRVGNCTLSPNGSTIAFTVTNVNIADNKGYTNIYTIPVTGGKPTQLTNSTSSKWSLSWSNDGESIFFMTMEDNLGRLSKLNTLDGSVHTISSGTLNITDYLFSPDETKILVTADIKVNNNIHDTYPDLPLANARIENDVMYRHWDEWEDGLFSHLLLCPITNDGFVANIADIDKPNGPIDLLKNEPFDVPVKPFGDMKEVCWSNDAKSIYYTCKKLSGKQYAVSTNTDIYNYDLKSGMTENLTQGMMGYDRNPSLSPDGKYLAWESMERDGYEADKNRLFIMNLQTKEKTELTNNFDQNVANISWSSDNTSIWFTSSTKATEQIYNIALATKSITQITSGKHDYIDFTPSTKFIIGVKTTMSAPAEIYQIEPATGNEVRLTFFTNQILDKVKMGKVEERWIKTTDNKEMLTWVIYPPNFDPNKKYPTLLYCQGGPQDPVSQFWSIRWNFQLMAANGYIVVAPNRRGLPGFGQEWNEQISGDYGGQNMLDYFAAIDAMAKEPFVNANKLGAVGASYGGFSVYWIAGNHNKRFKAFISHCGIFNLEQMYSTTEESFFTNFDLKGAYWDKNNAAAQRSYTFSPHRFVQNWDTPILCIHGANDYRIPEEQGMAAFNSAILKGVPAKFLYFPEENHWVLKPQNGILWHREFYKWLDRWLK